jgi:hypothetical protein
MVFSNQLVCEAAVDFELIFLFGIPIQPELPLTHSPHTPTSTFTSISTSSSTSYLSPQPLPPTSHFGRPPRPPARTSDLPQLHPISHTHLHLRPPTTTSEHPHPPPPPTSHSYLRPPTPTFTSDSCLELRLPPRPPPRHTEVHFLHNAKHS